MKARLLGLLPVVAGVVFLALALVAFAGGMFLIWIDGCSEMHMATYTCQFLPKILPGFVP